MTSLVGSLAESGEFLLVADQINYKLSRYTMNPTAYAGCAVTQGSSFQDGSLIGRLAKPAE